MRKMDNYDKLTFTELNLIEERERFPEQEYEDFLSEIDKQNEKEDEEWELYLAEKRKEAEGEEWSEWDSIDWINRKIQKEIKYLNKLSERKVR